jgi:hypothetical protein
MILLCHLQAIDQGLLHSSGSQIVPYMESVRNSLALLDKVEHMTPPLRHRCVMSFESVLGPLFLRAGNVIEAVQVRGALLAQANCRPPCSSLFCFQASNRVLEKALKLGSCYYDIISIASLYCAGQVFIRTGISSRTAQVRSAAVPPLNPVRRAKPELFITLDSRFFAQDSR